MNGSFGVKLPGLVPRWATTLRGLPDTVIELEKQGYDDICDGEHLLFAPVMAHPGGSGTMVHGRSTHQSDRADTLVMLSAIAARTTTIKLWSGVLLAAAHNFAVLARQAATLDLLSGGRFVLGVGPGWFTTEFEAMGIPPGERGKRLEETIRACQELWSPGLSSFDGRWIRFADVLAEPAPVTSGGVPVWFGGNALAGPTARRVVTLGQGWLSREAAGYEEVAKSIESITAACDQVGRDPSTVGFRASLTPTPPVPGSIDADRSPGEVIESAVAHGRRLADAGVTHFNIPANHYGLDVPRLGELLAALRSA